MNEKNRSKLGLVPACSTYKDICDELTRRINIINNRQDYMRRATEPNYQQPASLIVGRLKSFDVQGHACERNNLQGRRPIGM